MENWKEVQESLIKVEQDQQKFSCKQIPNSSEPVGSL